MFRDMKFQSEYLEKPFKFRATAADASVRG